MAQEIREFAVLVPAGTAKAAPLTVNIAFPERVVTSVRWRVPPGPAGVMGWALTSAGAPVIPIQPGAYVVADNQSSTWDLEGYLDSGNWQVTCYNTGAYPHTVFFTFLLDLPAPAVAPVPPPPGSGADLIGLLGMVSPPGPPGPPASSSPPQPAGAPADTTVTVPPAAGTIARPAAV